MEEEEEREGEAGGGGAGEEGRSIKNRREICNRGLLGSCRASSIRHLVLYLPASDPHKLFFSNSLTL